MRNTTYDVASGSTSPDGGLPDRRPRARPRPRGRRHRASARGTPARRRRCRRFRTPGVTRVGAGGQRLREGEQPGHRVVAVGGRRDPQREVVGGEHAGVAVVGVALGVAAAGRLEVDPAHPAPADGHDRLGGRGRAGGRVGDHPGDDDRLHRRQADRLGGGGGVRLGQQVVAGVLVGVREDQPARGQHDHASGAGGPRRARRSARGARRRTPPARPRRPRRPRRATTSG